MPGLPETVNKKRKYPMWAGGYSDLVRMLRVIQRQFELLLPAHIEHRTQWERARVESGEARIARLTAILDAGVASDEIRAMHEAELASARDDLEKMKSDLEEKTEEARTAGLIRVSVSLGGDRWESVGSADEIVNYVDGRKFSSLTFEAPGDIMLRGSTVRVEADRDDGVELRVSSNNDQWATATTTYLENEFRQRVPGWAFIRNYWALVPLWAVSLGIAMWFLLVLSVTALQSAGASPEDVVSPILLGFIVVYIFAITFAIALSRRLIPAIDIAADGKKNKGAALVGLLASAAATVALGVVTNLLTAGITAT
jgi:hypothetical protein